MTSTLGHEEQTEPGLPSRPGEVAMLLAISAALNASMTEAETVRVVADQARQLCDADMAAVALLHGGSITVVHRRAAGTWTEQRGDFHPRGTITGRVIATGQPYRSNDLSTDPYTDPELDSRYGLINQLSVPLGSSGRPPLGVLSLYNKRNGGAFSTHDQALLEAVAAQTTAALERTRAFEQATASLEALKHSEARWRNLVEHGSDTLFIVDPDGIVRWVGPGFARLRGASPESVLGGHAWQRIVPEDRPRADAFLENVLRAGSTQPLTIELRTTAENDHRWVQVTATNLLGDQAINGIVANVQDITERKRAERDLRASEARFRALVQNSSDLTVVYDRQGLIHYASPSATRVLGFRPDEIEGTSAFAWIHPDDQAMMRSRLEMQAATPNQQNRPAIVRLRHRGRGWCWAETQSVNLLHDPDVQGIVSNVRDVTERKELEERLSRQSLTDPVTHFANRPLFVDRLAQAVERGARIDRDVAVILADLDDFHQINDNLGSRTGDLLLEAVARRMAGCLQPGHTLARFGSDEFAILMDELGTPDAIAAMAQCLIDGLREPFSIEGHAITVNVSIGISHGTVGRHDPALLLRQADIALNLAKSGGGGRWVAFDPSTHAQTVEQLDLASELRGVVARGELQLHFQPEVELGSGRIFGAEALVRWVHPVRGMIGPGAFIPIAEQSDAILDIGRWVLEEACRSARLWQAAQPDGPPLVVSVNLAARQLQQSDLVEQVAETLRTSGLPPACLCLEVTESAAIQDIDTAITTLAGLRALGVTVAIDDFGTGYSSLSYLRRLPADFLKIDRSFLIELESNAQAVAIVRAVSALAHEMGMRVIVEGIETKQQLTSAILLMCDFGQGYYFARPVPEEDWRQMLRSGHQHPWLSS